MEIWQIKRQKEGTVTNRRGRQARDETDGSTSLIGGRVDRVPTKLISPHKFRKILYDTPRTRKVEIQVESSRPIDVYGVQASDIDAWKSEGDYEGISFQSTRTVNAQIKIERDFEKEWCLVLDNTSDTPAAVHYEVYDL